MEFFVVAQLDDDNIQTTWIYTTLEGAEKEYADIELNYVWSKAIIKVKEGESFGGSVQTLADTWDGGGEVLKQENRDADESVKPVGNRIKMFEQFKIK